MHWTAIILAAAQLALAAPVNDRIEPAEHEPSYVRSPMGRGTMDLLFTCVITLSLCVWTAVHPNIIARSTYMDRLRYKALYVVLGLFSPEIVLSEAFNEWRAARNLRDQLHRWTAEEIMTKAVDRARYIGRIPETNSTSDNGNLPKDLMLTYNRPLTPSDNDTQVQKARTALEKAIEIAKASGESTSPESWLQRAAKYLWKVVENAIEASVPPTQDEGTNGQEPPVSSDCARRILKQLTVLDKATKNYLSAKRISKAKQTSRLNGLRRWVIECLPFTSPSDEETPTFTMEIAFFIGMGGLTFSPIDHLEYRAYESTLSADGLMSLVSNRVVDPMRLLELKVDIQDKGKSDILAKVVVCAQASWMMMNCLLRKAAGLPITVIELNVIVHVMSMIAIYACWWKKPHDAGMPIPLNIFLKNQAVCSLLFMRDNYPEKDLGKEKTATSGTGRKPPSLVLSMAEGVHEQDFIDSARSQRSSSTPPTSVHAPAKDQQKNGAESGDVASEVEWGKGKRVKRGKKKLRFTGDHYLRIRADAVEALSLDCCKGVQQIKDISTLPGRFEFRSLVVVLIPLCFIYGGVHASLWNTYFPTPIERWLWRVSACIVAVPGLGSAAIWGVKMIISRDRSGYGAYPVRNLFESIFILMIIIPTVALMLALSIAVSAVPLGAMGGVIYGAILGHRKIMKLSRRLQALCYLEFLCSIALGVVITGVGSLFVVSGCVQMCIDCFKKWKEYFLRAMQVPLAVALLVAALFVIVYCGARVFILVETFICLRSLPVGAFKTVRWEEFWPHL